MPPYNSSRLSRSQYPKYLLLTTMPGNFKPSQWSILQAQPPIFLTCRVRTWSGSSLSGLVSTTDTFSTTFTTTKLASKTAEKAREMYYKNFDEMSDLPAQILITMTTLETVGELLAEREDIREMFREQLAASADKYRT